MIAKWACLSLLPILLTCGLSACGSRGVQPGIVNTSAAGPAMANGSTVIPGSSGRVFSIREVTLKGAGGGVSGQGALMGGIAGAVGGAAVGIATTQWADGGLVGGLVGAVLGAVGGAIAGSIIEGQPAAGRGIEVVVQRDDGQKITVAQRDDGDIQLGDRVQLVQDRQGVAKVVRDTTPPPD